MLKAPEALGKVSNGTVTVTLNGNEMASFDLEGRILYYGNGTSTFRRSIYNEVYRLEWIGKEQRIVEKLDNPEHFLERAYEIARKAKELTSDPILKESLEILSNRSTHWLAEDARRAEKLYTRISIVPPDLYFSTYLQLTSGCPWNKCSFCSLYGETEYSVKSLDQFSSHVRAVKEYLGRGIEARKNIFLGDANATGLSRKFLKEIFNAVVKEFDNPSIYSFVDAFTTPRNLNGKDIEELLDLGLKRVYLGLESGDGEVLKILNKPVDPNEAREFTRELKNAGVSVGVIILIGAGGQEYWTQHVKHSVETLQEMNLGRGDVVYLSPLAENESYRDLARRLNIGILSEKEKEKQSEEIQNLLSKGINCPIARYDIRESFVS